MSSATILCPICDTALTHKVLNPDGQTFSPYWACPYCDCWSQNPMPPKVFEAAHEKTATGEYAGHLMSDYEKSCNKYIAENLFVNFLDSKPVKMLDIGSKYPYLSYCFNQLGCEAFGMDNLDIIPEYSEELQVPMLVADFEAISEQQIQDWTKTEKFGLITMIHCFEHMYDPLEALRKLRKLISDDGIVFFRLPDHSVDGYERDLTEGHYTIHPYYHSTSSILALLAKGENLFTIIDMKPSKGHGQTDLVLKPITRKPTLHCGMIVKNEERDLPRCIKSILPIVDNLVIVDTGSTDATERVARETVGDKIPLDFSTYLGASKQDEQGDWKLWDFGKARNQFIEKIENNPDADYLIWMDADDELLTPDHLQRALYCNFVDAFGLQIETDGQRWVHCRLWKTGKDIHFAGKIHEYPVLHDLSYVDLKDSVIRHDPAPTGTGEGANPRNLRILEAEFEEDPNSTRLAFYLGNTHKDASRYDEAIPYYQKRIDLGKAFWDEWVFAFLYKARCERAAGHLEAAKTTLFKGIAEAPGWSEFWMELSYMSYVAGNFEEAIGYALLCVSRPIPPTQLWREKDKYVDQPLRMISWCHEEMGNYQEAVAFAVKAKESLQREDTEWEARIARLEALLYSAFEKRGNSKRIALHRPGAIGDVIMTLNIIPELQKKWPNHAIDYYCAAQIGANLKELMVFAGVADVLDCTTLSENSHKYDKVFNLIGYPLHENYPNAGPIRQHLIQYFAEEVGVDPKIWALALGTPKLELPDLPEVYATMQVQAGWSTYKNWPVERWKELVDRCQGIPIIQIGAASDPKIPGAIHSFMGYQLMLSIALIAKAKMHIGVDSFANHVTNYWWQDPGSTALRRVPAVILWGSTQSTGSGYKHNTNISLGLPCSPCWREDPAISSMSRGPCQNPPDQSYQHPKHACMFDISVDMVEEAVKTLWNKVNQ